MTVGLESIKEVVDQSESEEILLAYFSEIFDRQEKIEGLRELILKLAIKGKLVKQNDEDEKANILLQKIKSIKDNLIKTKQIKKSDFRIEKEEEKECYCIPENWKWAKLGEIGEIVGGGTPKTNNSEYFAKNDISWITPADLNKLKGKYIGKGKRDISRAGLENSSAKLVPTGTVLFSSRAPIGYVAIANNELATNQGFKSCVPYIKECNEYIYYFLKIKGKEIDENASGTTFKEVSGKFMSNVLIPIPPLSEQKRIVVKVDLLMNFCDKLEQALQKKIQYKSLSAKSVFNSVGPVLNSKELEKTLKFIIENFKELSLSDDAVKELKSCILQLAIQGKLVKQDLNDEPASLLLEKIKKEKEILIKEKKIKREKSLGEITKEEKGFEIPNNWAFGRVGEYTIVSPRNDVEDETETSFIPMKLIDDGFNNSHDYEVRKWGEIKKGFTHFADRDICIAKITPCFENRKSVVMNGLENNVGAGTTELYVVRTINELIVPEYLLWTFKTKKFIDGGIATYTGTAGQQRVKKDYLQNFVLPIPPLEEQKRIVREINKFMRLCDILEEKINELKNYNEKLMNSVIRKVCEI